MPTITIENLGDIKKLRRQVREAAACTRAKFAKIAADPMEALHTLKFCAYGFDPLLEAKSLNLIEQLNQTFTIMASLAAAERLLDWFEVPGGLRLNLAETAGWDIKSIDDNLIRAEVFAAVRPSNDSKLSKDIDKMSQSNACNRFVFYYCHEGKPSEARIKKAKDAGITICRLTKDEVM